MSEPVKLSEGSFRVLIDPGHHKSNGESEKTVTGLVSPSGVFGIDRRTDLEQEIKEKVLGWDNSDQLWLITHIPTGRRIGFQISLEAAKRNIDLLEPHADEMNVGQFGQDATKCFDEKCRGKLAWNVMLAEHVAEMEFAEGPES